MAVPMNNEKRCEPLGRLLGQLFKPARPFNSPPPDLTGRKRVYCCDCGKRWIMVQPDYIEFHTVTHPFRCMQCRKIRHEKMKYIGMRVDCVNYCGSYMRVLPSEFMSHYGKFKCGDCMIGRNKKNGGKTK